MPRRQELEQIEMKNDGKWNDVKYVRLEMWNLFYQLGKKEETKEINQVKRSEKGSQTTWLLCLDCAHSTMTNDNCDSE